MTPCAQSWLSFYLSTAYVRLLWHVAVAAHRVYNAAAARLKDRNPLPPDVDLLTCEDRCDLLALGFEPVCRRAG